ncbi:cholecystokinin receptor type A [Macrosteles quadrilineatus]|uniref:cholecystokinin receptor type A n=1 Tax=Macrosteles quadrilineatus TaxID=74068 RepID=UPI0023E09BC4|nr:cholecystokinin receptor type A [Macrosteles quadrilineatus]
MTTYYNFSALNVTDSPAVEAPPLHSLVVLYVVVLVVGLLGNAFVAAAIWSQRVVRNILLLNLCASDFLVCCLSAPVSIVAALQQGWTLGLVPCKIVFFLQGVPVAASTWSLMMLSLDRYTSIQHPRVLTRFRERRHLSFLMIGVVWCVSLAVCSPIIYSRTIIGDPGPCEEVWEDTSLWTTFVLGHVTLVYLLPGLTVAACHHSVGHKLYAASLSAAVANGDIPLPMPTLCRPKEVIIIASVQNDMPSKVIHYKHDQEDSDDAKNGAKIRSDIAEHRRGGTLKGRPQTDSRRKKLPKSPKQARAARSPRRPPLTKQASRQSLHSRRRLAQMLVALVVVFATCWLPYVTLRIYSVTSSSDPALIQSLLPFCLLLGHTHSAINPIVYWFLNRQSLQTTSCVAWLRKGSQRDKLANHFRFLGNNPVDHRRPSSTNEAALGAFHPRYTVPKTRPRVHQPRESSQFYA